MLLHAFACYGKATAIVLLRSYIILCTLALPVGGGIRANKDYPDSTEFFFLSDLESEMPFNNELVCVDMPGRVISDIVAYTRSFSFQNPPVEYGGFMQVHPVTTHAGTLPCLAFSGVDELDSKADAVCYSPVRHGCLCTPFH